MEPLIDSYNNIINEYEKHGDLKWTDGRGNFNSIVSMDDETIKDKIKRISNLKRSGLRSGWLYVLNDVLLQRRKEKLNKILNKIK